MNVPANLKYSNDHEWCRVEGDTAVIGITDFAQSHATQRKSCTGALTAGKMFFMQMDM